MSDEKAMVQQNEEQNAVIDIQNTGYKLTTIWNNDKLMARAFKAAKFLSESSLVPDRFRGKAADCLIALDLANNIGCSPLTVMQSLYLVHGQPAWSGQMCISLVNNARRFAEPLEFVFVGEGGTKTWGCYAQAHNHAGKLVKGTTVTMQMAADEGWISKNGSKWKTMPEQMLQYRAGAFFARVNCPDLLLGLPTVEEVNDVKGYESEEKKTVTINIGDENNG